MTLEGLRVPIAESDADCHAHGVRAVRAAVPVEASRST